MGRDLIAALVITVAIVAFLLAPDDARATAGGFMLCVVFGELRQFKGAGNG